MHLLESGEFLNVGLFCRVSVTKGTLVYFYLMPAAVVVFFLFDIFIPFFFCFFFLV